MKIGNHCRFNSKIYKYIIIIITVQGPDKDDTAMNGISFKCTSGDTLATAGMWGPWGNWYKCPGGFSGAKFKNEEIQVYFYLLLYAIVITLHN